MEDEAIEVDPRWAKRIVDVLGLSLDDIDSDHIESICSILVEFSDYRAAEAASPAAGWLTSDTTSSAAPAATHRHYKGDLVAVVSEVTDEETLEPRVIYMHNGKLWDRRKAVFEQSVTWQGKSVPRFIHLPASPSEEARAG